MDMKLEKKSVANLDPLMAERWEITWEDLTVDPKGIK
jgi:hypothetical protein